MTMMTTPTMTTPLTTAPMPPPVRSADERLLLVLLARAMAALTRISIALPASPWTQLAGDAASDVLDMLDAPSRRSLQRAYLVELKRIGVKS